MSDCVNNAAIGRAGTNDPQDRGRPYETIYVFGGGRAAVADCFVNNAALGRAATGGCPYIYIFGGGQAAMLDCSVNNADPCAWALPVIPAKAGIQDQVQPGAQPCVPTPHIYVPGGARLGSAEVGHERLLCK
jgi:hypothetical protein